MKSPETLTKSYRNNMGIKGWAYGGSYGVERYLYTLHRITGLGVLLYLVMHIGLTWFKNDPQTWDKLMAVVENPAFKLGEFMVFFGVAYHAINGIRLIAGEFGFLLGKPIRPVYPYPVASSRQRPLLIGLMLLTAVFVIYGALDIFILTH